LDRQRTCCWLYEHEGEEEASAPDTADGKGDTADDAATKQPGWAAALVVLATWLTVSRLNPERSIDDSITNTQYVLRCEAKERDAVESGDRKPEARWQVAMVRRGSAA